MLSVFFFQAEDGIRDDLVTGVQTCALPILIYAAYQFVIPYIMLGSDPGPHADVLMTLIVRQSFENSLFGLGAAISTLLMLAMCVWVLIWYRAFRRDFEVATA